MPRKKSRGRERRLRLLASLREAVRRAKTADARERKWHPLKPGDGELWRVLRSIDRAGLCVRDVAIACTEEELFMIQQAIDTWLPGYTPRRGGGTT